MKRPLSIAALAASAVLVLAACAQTLDTSQAEEEISKGILEQTDISVKVTCPDGVEVKAGAVFECVGEAETGEKITIKVTQEDDQGNVAWEVVTP